MRYNYVFSLPQQIISEIETDEPLAGIAVGNELLLDGDLTKENHGLLTIAAVRAVVVGISQQLTTHQILVLCEPTTRRDAFSA